MPAGRAGAWAVNEVGPLTTTPVAATPPIVTVAPGWKFSPETIRDVAPPAGPEAGVTAWTCGTHPRSTETDFELFAVLGSLVTAETVAARVRSPGAIPARTESESTGAGPTSIRARVHVTGAVPEHDHPSPDQDWRVPPVGSVAAIATVVAALGPAFEAVSVQVIVSPGQTLRGSGVGGQREVGRREGRDVRRRGRPGDDRVTRGAAVGPDREAVGIPPSVCGEAAMIVFFDPTITVFVNGVGEPRSPTTRRRPVELDERSG